MNTRLCACLFLLAAACETPKSASSPYAPPPDPNAPMPTNLVLEKPWTTRFLKPSALIAQNVRIEGPDGLLEHCVVRQELGVVDVETKTTPDGLLQTVRVKPGLVDVEIRAHLDNLTIVGLREISVLERPGPVDVVVTANGDAFFQEKDTQTEQRGAQLRLVGPVDRTGAPR